MKIKMKLNMKTLFIILAMITSIDIIGGDNINNYKQLINLKGNWKFMIGDDLKRSNPSYNDTNWENIIAPSSWEDQGFPGYDGYAWYRKTVTIPSINKNQKMILYLGYIDDVDEVYFNGYKIGHKGSFPPNYWTAYNSERLYLIPQELIKNNQSNIIAVRVYDSQLGGGIVNGEIGIYVKEVELPPDISLEGFWKFKTGDNMEWATKGFPDSAWKKITVPGYWEDQIVSDYDGFGWYRKHFKVDEAFKEKRFVLMLGKIDDLDEVYINGKLVGHTGTIYKDTTKIYMNGEYIQDRYYYLNQDVLLPGQINTIAVRVYDGYGEGGIYSGPIGLIELRKFVNYWRVRNR